MRLVINFVQRSLKDRSSTFVLQLVFLALPSRIDLHLAMMRLHQARPISISDQRVETQNCDHLPYFALRPNQSDGAALIQPRAL
jgi:hypothetical protein